jgi:HEAT repeat protein
MIFNRFFRPRIDKLVRKKDVTRLLQIVIQDSSFETRKAAVCALGEIGFHAFDALAKISLSQQFLPGLQLTAMETLVSAGDPGAKEILFQSLLNDPFCRQGVVHLLTQFHGEDVVLKIASLLKCDTSSDTRASAARALGNLGESAFQPLVEALGDVDSNVRLVSLESLLRLKDPRTSDHIVRLLGDTNHDIFSKTIDALETIQKTEINEMLLSRVDDANWMTRGAAIRELGRRNESRVLSKLYEKLEQEKKERKIYEREVEVWRLGRGVLPRDDAYNANVEDILYALGNIGGRAAIPFLFEWMLNGRRDETKYARDSLRRIRDSLGTIAFRIEICRNGIMEVLLNGLKDSSAYRRAMAAQALGVLQDPTLIPALIECMCHDNEIYQCNMAVVVAQFALEALLEIGLPRTVLTNALRNVDSAVHCHADWCLSQIDPNFENVRWTDEKRQ